MPIHRELSGNEQRRSASSRGASADRFTGLDPAAIRPRPDPPSALRGATWAITGTELTGTNLSKLAGVQLE